MNTAEKVGPAVPSGPRAHNEGQSHSSGSNVRHASFDAQRRRVAFLAVVCIQLLTISTPALDRPIVLQSNSTNILELGQKVEALWLSGKNLSPTICKVTELNPGRYATFIPTVPP